MCSSPTLTMKDDSGEGGDGQRDEADDDTEQREPAVSLVPVSAHANSTRPKMAMAISKVFIAYASDVKVRGSQQATRRNRR